MADHIDSLTNETLSTWVMSLVEEWNDFYDSNFKQKNLEYERIWRGICKESDKTRKSERSKIVAPHTSQAVESAVAEVEEAIYGRGSLFDITDNEGDDDKQDVQTLRNQLNEDLSRRKVRRKISECILTGALYGNGAAEIVTTTITERKPASQRNGNAIEVGVTSTKRVVCDIIPISVENLRVDPAATSIDDGIGVAIDDYYVPVHQVQLMQAKGVYDDTIHVAATGNQIVQKNQGLTRQPEDVVRITKYYGLVPKSLLERVAGTADNDPLSAFEAADSPPVEGTIPESSDWVEACVVILNGQHVLKGIKNPYMMQDRPVVAFAWDIIPGLFNGRGVPEKGYSIQKALDGELRARADALALTAAPMMGVDATKMPRGMRPRVQPGRTVVTIGNPKDALMPFNFGQVSQITFAQAESLGRMLQQATGAVDSTGVGATGNNDRAAAGISMNLGAIIKRHKRTLINFQDDFLVPLVEKCAWRYMQYDPDNYPAADYKFTVSSSLGIMAREYETSQLVQLLQTMKPGTLEYSLIIESVVGNMNVAQRETIVQALKDGRETTPEQQEAQARAQEAEVNIKEQQGAALEGTAAEAFARAKKYAAETLAIPIELQNERIMAISNNLTDGDQDEKNFRRRAEVAKLLQTDRSQDFEEFKLLNQNRA